MGYDVLALERVGRPAKWSTGTRPFGERAALPLDLREAYSRARLLGECYGDLIDAWEIENEPDWFSVPENPEHYVAYLKACYLGLKQGIAQALVHHDAWDGKLEDRSPALARRSKAMILMAPLCLPPGPYFDRLLANELLSYTDGFNFHYYGYAEDFTDVYRQYQDAVGSFGRRIEGQVSIPATPRAPPATRRLPVFVSEYGYGSLSALGGASVEGRVRQWRWFRSAQMQMSRLGVAAPIAFLLPSYFEDGTKEFGLVMHGPQLAFTPADFGAAAEDEWMQSIGAYVDHGRISPALAWLASHAANPTEPQTWPVRVPSRTSVVIDLVAGEGMTATKYWRGYFLGQNERATFVGNAKIRVYNLGLEPQTGRLSLGPEATLSNRQLSGQTLTLQPGEMRELDVRLGIANHREDFRVEFAVADGQGTVSRFATLLYPELTALKRVELVPLEFRAADARRHADALVSRQLASEEPPLHRQGRWLVTEGLRVSEENGTWRFTVSSFPGQPLRPAIAELPLPQGSDITLESYLQYSIRLVPREAAAISQTSEPTNNPLVASAISEGFALFWRSENENLYCINPTQQVGNEWMPQALPAYEVPMWFYGRAHLPSRLSDGKVAALEIHFRPVFLPATYEMRNVALTRYYVPPTTAKLTQRDAATQSDSTAR